MRQAILCVDDEAIIAMALKQELRQHFRDRFIYESAISAEEALDIIDDLTSDGVGLVLVISDWLMPGMKGDEFLTRVKSAHANVKTLLVTGQAPPEVTEALRRDGIAQSVVYKPWKGAELIKLVEDCVSQPDAGSCQGG